MARRKNEDSAFIADLMRRHSLPENAHISADQILRDTVADGLRGKLEEPNKEQKEVAYARGLAARGKPFLLVATQWPDLVIDETTEEGRGDARLFREACTDERLAFATLQMRESILDWVNDSTTPTLRLDWWQMVVIAAVFDPRISEIYIKGCTGAGKGGSTAIAVNMWYDAFHSSRTTLTSETFTHAQANIFGEVCEWRRRMRHPAAGAVLKESVAENERHYIMVRNPAAGEGESFSGAHGPNTLYVFDEATASPDVLIKNAEKNARKMMLLANPRTLAGRFREAFTPLGDKINENGIFLGNIGLRMCLTIGGRDCINVAQNRLKGMMVPRGGMEIDGKGYGEGELVPDDKLKFVKPLIPNQIDLALYRNNKAKADKREADIFAEGWFPEEDATKQVILVSWLRACFQQWMKVWESIKAKAFGLDVARSLLGDRTALSWGDEKGIAKFHQFRIPDVTLIADEVLRIANESAKVNLTLGGVPICIDYGGGYGSGVGDILAGRGCWVIPFQPSSTSQVSPRNFANLRTEAYAMLGKRLDPAGPFAHSHPPLALPEEEGLAAELCAPEKKTGTDGIRFGLEPKEEIKSKLRGVSPDLADTATYWFHALRVVMEYDQWVMSVGNRPLVLYPTKEDLRKIERGSQTSGGGEKIFGDAVDDATADNAGDLFAERTSPPPATVADSDSGAGSVLMETIREIGAMFRENSRR